jgi:hypothetical protein
MRSVSLRTLAIALASILAAAALPRVTAQSTAALVSPADFLGFPVGADNKLARWDRIVDYMRQASTSSGRVRFRELGKTSNGNPFIVLEISSPDTLENLDRYKTLQRKLYFQGGAPGDAERDDIFRQGKLVLLVTCKRTTVVARYPNTDVVASGWLKAEELMAGRAAVISVEMNSGRIVLFGLRPQHRAQTHATFPMLFNSLYLATTVAPGS